MRRKDREVADLEGQLAILEQCPVCRVAINDPASGVPYLVPLNFGMAAGPQSLTLYFHCARAGHKYEAVKACPRASFCVVDSSEVVPEDYSTDYRSVIVFGRVRELTESAEKRRA